MKLVSSLSISLLLAPIISVQAQNNDTTTASHPCNDLPGCDQCLSVRMDCAWIDGVCEDPNLCGANKFQCYHPSLYPDLTGPQICLTAEGDGVDVGVSMGDLDCPEPPADSICTLQYDPFVCVGGEGTDDTMTQFECDYDNACLAEAAGFALEDCEPAMGGEEDTTTTTTATTTNVTTPNLDATAGETPISPTEDCPTPPAESICTMEYLPVVCQGVEGTDDVTNEFTCEYDNACLAEASGFVADDCQFLEENPVEEPPELNQMADGGDECPTMDPNTMCTMEYAPVVCQSGQCEYSNGCQAAASGFVVATECVPKEDEIPSTTPPPTPTDEDNAAETATETTPCNGLPSCEPCLNSRIDCAWVGLACQEPTACDDAAEDATCYHPSVFPNMTGPEICAMATEEDESHPCNGFPTCESCLNSRIDCAWIDGVCQAPTLCGVADGICYHPSLPEFANMTGPDICVVAEEEGDSTAALIGDGEEPDQETAPSDSYECPEIGADVECGECLNAGCVLTVGGCLSDCVIADAACWDMRYHEGMSVDEVCAMAEEDAANPVDGPTDGGADDTYPFACPEVTENAECNDCLEIGCVYTDNKCLTECAIMDISCWDMQYHEDKTVGEVCDMAMNEEPLTGPTDGGMEETPSPTDGGMEETPSPTNPFACPIGETTDCIDCLATGCVYTNELCLTECAIMDIACWDMQYHEGKTVATVCDMAANEEPPTGPTDGSVPGAESEVDIERGASGAETVDKDPQQAVSGASSLSTCLGAATGFLLGMAVW